MKSFSKLLILGITVLSSSFAFGDIESCEEAPILTIMVNGDRGIEAFGNKLIVALKDTTGGSLVCGDNGYFFMANTDPAFNGVLSLLLAAKAKNDKVKMYVNTSSKIGGATSISHIEYR